MLRRIHLKNSRKRHRRSAKTRSYFAAMGANEQPMPARIVQSLDETKLQLHVPNRYIPQKELLDNPRLRYIADPADFYTIKLGETHTWNTMFKIKKDGLAINNYMFFSDELMKHYEKNLGYHMALGLAYNSRFHSDFYFPNLLFSIPQPVWNDFIAKLPHQNVVKNLNLSAYRHLIVAYTYCVVYTFEPIKDADIIHYRSDAIGKYHFLASIIAAATSYRFHLTTSDRFDLKDVYSKDSIRYFYADNLTSCFPIDIDLNFPDVFKQIDQGKEPAKLLTNRLPYLTPLFLNKFSQCPVWHDVHNIGTNLILPQATNRLGDINKNKLDGFIADLPSSKKDPLHFSNMVQDSRKILTKHLNKKLSSSFFFQSRNNFGHYDSKDHALIKDYITALCKDLIFPEFIRQLHHLSSEQCEKMTIDVTTIIDDRYHLDTILSSKLNTLLSEIIGSIQLNQLNQLQQRWHRNITLIEAHKPVSPFKFEWHALFEPETIGNVTFTCLTTNTQLRAEGDEMHHCVSGYSNRCMSGKSHIVKIVTQSGERSTLELSVDRETQKINIVQNQDDRNTTPSQEILSATNELLRNLNNKKIPINSKQGSISGETIIAANEIYPYSFSDNGARRNIQSI